ncbi:MAG TPA: efflux RND transporter periplasmic adaptor subunit [Steroidobacteraceae bacterium]|nr:efflux RND transporter periplasmic adaptor subunit [Steroidobacteraceae bacterium]
MLRTTRDPPDAAVRPARDPLLARVELSAMDRPLERRWVTRSRATTAVIVLVGLGAATAGYVRYGLTRAVRIGADRVVVGTVRAGIFQEYIPIDGSVEPRETVYLDAVDGGQVTQVLVEEGALVKAGQPLVTLSNANLQLQVLNSEAQLSEQLDRLTSTKLQFEQTRLTHARDLIDARFQTEKARQSLARLVPLGNSGVVRRADLEDAKLEYDRQQGLLTELMHAQQVDESLQRQQIEQIDRLVANLNRNLTIARQNLDNLTLKAPFDGQLTTLQAHLGESKLVGQRIGQIDRIDGYKVVALVDEHYLQRVLMGQHATPDPDATLSLKQGFSVMKVYPEVRDRQFKVDLAFDGGAPATVRRGQSVPLRLQIGGERHGLILDNGAFYDDTGGQWAFVLNEDGTLAHRRSVRLGRRNQEQVEVLQGLAPGERVIVSSYDGWKDADRIELRKKGD